MKCIYTGLESAGKSLMLSKKAEEIFQRNAKWFRETGLPRTMFFNMPMSEDFIERLENNGVIYKEFRQLEEILFQEECDIFIDEVLKFFPSSGSSSLTNEQLHFITQGEKSGISVYGTSQDFSQVHKQFRRLIQEVWVVSKIIGSRRPMKTAPPIKRIWGLCMARPVNPRTFSGDDATMDALGFPTFFTIRKEDTMRYNTSYKVPMSDLPVKIVRKQIERGYEDGVVVHEKTTWK